MSTEYDETEVDDHVCHQGHEGHGQNLGPIKHAYPKPMEDPRGREDAGGYVAPVVQIPQRTDLAAEFPEIKGSNETQGARDIWREDQSGRKQDRERKHECDGSPNGTSQEVGNDHNNKPRE